MIELSERTIARIKSLFPENQWKEVEGLMRSQCGDNIPFCENSDKHKMDRIRFAVLKLSEGSLEKLVYSLQVAKTDWRDLLLAAGFGEDIEAHNKWKP